MRVLHLHSGNLFGGTETLLLTLARHHGDGAPFDFGFGLCFDGNLAGRLREEGFEPQILGAVRTSRPLTIFRARKQLARHLAAQLYDVVICHSPWVLAVLGPAVRAAGIPLVFWQHDAMRGAHWIHRWASRTPPDLAICNSRYTAGTLPTLFENVPSAVVFCPVDPPATVAAADRPRLRAELGTPDGAVVQIQVGRMERFKGYHAHLEALARVGETSRPLVSWIAGGAQRPEEERYLAELRARAAELGIAPQVRFLGHRNDVPSLLAAADVYCQPNVLPEPFGISIVEALYAGLPVISTAFGGAAEIVTGSCGLLVPPDDLDSLARTMRRLAESDALREDLGRGGPARAAEISDPTRVLAELAEILAGVVDGTRRGVARRGRRG